VRLRCSTALYRAAARTGSIPNQRHGARISKRQMACGVAHQSTHNIHCGTHMRPHKHTSEHTCKGTHPTTAGCCDVLA
jgi:hypothetical protein